MYLTLFVRKKTPINGKTLRNKENLTLTVPLTTLLYKYSYLQKIAISTPSVESDVTTTSILSDDGKLK